MRFLPALPLSLIVGTAWLAVGCGAASPAPADCGIAPLVFDERGTVQGDDGADTCARAERSLLPPEPDTLCKACPFELHRVVVVRGGERFDVADPARLEYAPSHHNWRDVMRATIDDAHAVRLTLGYLIEGPTDEASSWQLTLEILGDGDDVIDGPVELALEPNAQ